MVMKDDRWYNLVDKVAVPCSINEINWKMDNHVASDILEGNVVVSTVFLYLDHNWMNDGKPLLFETMVFGGVYDNFQERCSTYDEAIRQHRTVLRMVQEEYAPIEGENTNEV